MTTLVYEDVNGLDFIPEFEKLFPEHYDELCVTKDYPANPNYDAYRQMGEAGLLRTITCRADDELVGYIIFYIQPHLHYKDCLTAFEDLYFVKKDINEKDIKWIEITINCLNFTSILVTEITKSCNFKLFSCIGK